MIKIKGGKLKAYLETILELIEDKPNFLIPSFFYCILVQILFHQIAGYIFSSYESKPLTEQKIQFIAHINEVSPFTFLLFFKGNDTLSMIVFFFMNGIMYFYFIYVGIITVFKKKYKYYYLQNKKTFSKVNQILNVFFTFYWWIFFTPFMEINSGILVCGSNSFLVAYRTKSCSEKPIILIIFTIIGLIMTLATAFIIIFFFRNYEFNEQNSLKRRYHFVLILQVIGRFLLTFFYYLNLEIVAVFKHFIAQFLSLSFLYDILTNWPFGNKIVSRYYSCSSIIFEVSITFCHIWIFTNNLPDTEFFYFFIYTSTLSSALIIILWNSKYEDLLKIDENSFPKNFKQMDYFLEEFVLLLNQNSKSEDSKFKLFRALIYHQQECKDTLCYCKSVTTFQDIGDDINKDSVFLIVDSLFKWALKRPEIFKNSREFEHLSLKYISYLAKYRNNTSRAYYELKVLLSARANISFYFSSISKILSKNIETIMEQKLTQKKKDKNDVDDMDLSLVWEMEQLKQKFIPTMIEALKEKISFWEKMKQGFQKMDQSMIFSIQKISLIKQLDNEFREFLTRLTGEQVSCFIFFKIRAMFELLVKNQIVSAAKFEIQASELKKKDAPKLGDCIHNMSLIKQQVLTFMVSFSKQRGKIVSKKQPFMEKFFGFDETDQYSLQSINHLMPKFIGDLHNDLMENMNWYEFSIYFNNYFITSFVLFPRNGHSKLIKGNLNTFCCDKSGHIYPVKIYLDHSFGHFDDFCLLASILKVPTSNEYILFDSTGKILGISNHIFQQLFGNNPKITLTRLFKFGYIFLLFKEILFDIQDLQHEVENLIDDQRTNISSQKKASINMNSNFEHIFETFSFFLSQQSQGKEFDFKEAKTVLMSKFIINSPQGQKSEQFSVKALQSEVRSPLSKSKLDLFDIATRSMIQLFLEQISQKKNISLSKSSYTSSTSHQFQEQLMRVRLFFKYTLQFQNLRYSENKQEFKYFILEIKDMVVQQKKLSSSSSSLNQTTIRMNTYSSMKISNKTDFKLKSQFSKKQTNQTNQTIFIGSEDKISKGNSQFINIFKDDVVESALTPLQEQKQREEQGNCEGSDDYEKSEEWSRIDEEDENQFHESYLSENKQNNQLSFQNHNIYMARKDEVVSNIQESKKEEEQSPSYFQDKIHQSGTAEFPFSVLQDLLGNVKYDKEKMEDKYNQIHQFDSYYQSKVSIFEDISKQETSGDPSKQLINLHPSMNNDIDLGISTGRTRITHNNNNLQVLLSDNFLNDSSRQQIDQSGINNDESYRKKSTSNHFNISKQAYASDLQGGGDLIYSIKIGEPPLSQNKGAEKNKNNNNDIFYSTERNLLPQSYVTEHQTTHQGYFNVSQEILPTGDDKSVSLMQNKNNQSKQNYSNLELEIGQNKLNTIQTDLVSTLNKEHQFFQNDFKLNSFGQSHIDANNLQTSLKKELIQSIDMKNQNQKRKSFLKNRYNHEKRNSNRQEEEENAMQQSLASHTSIRSSYGTQYVKEIITQKRLPQSAKRLKYIYQSFVLSFICLVLICIIYLTSQISIISNDMNDFTDLQIFINSYSKGLLSAIGLLSIDCGLYSSEYSSPNKILFKSYLSESKSNFTSSLEILQNELLINSQKYGTINIEMKDYYGNQENISQFQFINLIQLVQNTFFSLFHSSSIQLSPFYLLRSNYHTFLTQITLVKSLSNDKLDRDQEQVEMSFILFTIISCTFCFIVVLTGIPLIKKTNMYKEKLLLLVTRIRYDELFNEIDKYRICLEQLQSKNESYLSFDFFHIYTSKRISVIPKPKQVKIKSILQQHQQQREQHNQMEELNKNQTPEDMNETFASKLKKSQIKKKGETKTSPSKNQQQVHKQNVVNSKTPQKNQQQVYKQNVVSSKIFEQKLSFFKQCIAFFSITVIAMVFFFFILGYLIIQQNSIQPSLAISRAALNVGMSVGAFYVYSELLATENQFSKNLQNYPLQTIADRQELSNQMIYHLNQIQSFQTQNMDKLYGSNTISSSYLSAIKELYQKELCLSFPTVSNCNDFVQGISGGLTEIVNLQVSYSNIFDSVQIPSETEIIGYINSNEHHKKIVQSYLTLDKALQQFCNLIIEANDQIIQTISSTINLILYISGPIILIILIIFFTNGWYSLKKELISLNYMLLLIPEEKLQDEITIQMLKALKAC